MVAINRPVSINGRAPTFGSKVEATPAKVMTPTENGKKAKPDFNALYPRTFWK